MSWFREYIWLAAVGSDVRMPTSMSGLDEQSRRVPFLQPHPDQKQI